MENLHTDKPEKAADVKMTPFPAENAEDHDWVLIFPGGGYNHLSLEKEGSKIAEALNREGLNAMVLHYRVSPWTHPDILSDAVRAVRRVRHLIRSRGSGSGRLAVMGFSAGGHLALTETEHWQEVKEEEYSETGRPDALILCYPVVTFRDPFAHQGSRECFLGKADPSNAELVDKYSAECHIGPDFPPAFIWHCESDRSVPVENSLMLRDTLERAGIDHKLMIFSGGEHGMGLAPNDPIISGWFPACADWLREQGFR